MESKGMKLIKRVIDLRERGEINTFTMTEEAKKELQGLLGTNKIDSQLALSFIRDGIVREMCDIKDKTNREDKLFDNILLTISVMTAVIDERLIEIGAEV